MRKRVGAGYLLAAALPLLSLAMFMLRLAGGASRIAALGLYALGLLALAFTVKRHPTSLRRLQTGRRTVSAWLGDNGNALLTFAVFIVAGGVLAVLVPPGHTDLETAPDLSARLDRDEGRVMISGPRLRDAADDVRALAKNPGVSLDPDQRAALVRAWSVYLDHAIALDRVVDVHQYFYRINPIRHLDLNTRSFLTGYGAFVAELAGAVRLVDALEGLEGQRDVATVLNEPRPELGVPAGAFYRLSQSLLEPNSALRFHAGRAHLQLLAAAGRLEGPREVALLEATRAAYSEVSRKVLEAPGRFGDAPADLLEKTVFPAWFPLQKRVSEAMGDIRTTRRPALVGPEQVKRLGELLEPGDVLIERRNWYLSNIGLPGFWPHAALFTGTPDEQDRYFGEGDRAAISGRTPSEHLREAFPRIAQAFALPGEHGPVRILEAISEGVSLTSLEHSAGADYVAVLRPKVSRGAKLGAILKAYAMWGRPYDFDFDFVTDDAIVCSELVYKAYRPSEGAPGLAFELARTADRWVYPPNDLIRKFDAELGTPKEDFSFIAFVDGSEETHTASFRDAEALRASWRRPKWDVLQK